MDAKALFSLSYGLYIISTNHDGKASGCVINTLHQVTSSPTQVSIAVNKDNYTQSQIEQSGKFEAMILTQDVDMDVIGTFGFHSSKNMNKFETLPHELDEYGIPYLTQHVASRLLCRVVLAMDIGTHMLFIAEVEDAQVLSSEEVMTYAYYHQVKNGLTPKNASTFQETNNEVKRGWRCTICGYIYEGDPLPSDFICPICKADASAFEKL